MSITHPAATVLLAAITVDTGVAFGQDYPNKPPRLVTTTTGSTNELIARLIAPGIATPFRRFLKK